MGVSAIEVEAFPLEGTVTVFHGNTAEEKKVKRKNTTCLQREGREVILIKHGSGWGLVLTSLSRSLIWFLQESILITVPAVAAGCTVVIPTDNVIMVTIKL
ncbi:hypothetical protein Dimus_022017 [Dionaea muscipula]